MGNEKHEKFQYDYDDDNNTRNYELQVPNGGWGYIVVIATTVIFIVTIIPMAAFGIVFGEFLRGLGHETTGTTLSNGLFNTISSFMGLISNVVLNRFSFRKAALAGSLIFFIGTIGVVFSHNLYDFIFFFGIVQGIGFGLLLPSTFSAINSYFNTKLAFVMSLAQVVMVLGNMLAPYITAWTMITFGYRQTLIILAGISLLCIPASITLQPVKWHMKKVPIDYQYSDDNNNKKTETSKIQIDSLNPQQTLALVGTSHKSLIKEKLYISTVPRKSIISLGDRVASVNAINDLIDDEKTVKMEEKKLSFWQTLMKSMDLSLFKEIKYLNMSIGLALCFTADVAFVAIIPLMLTNIGFKTKEITLILSVFFGSDLIARILLSIISKLIVIKSRYFVLSAALFSAIFRIALVYDDTYYWKLTIMAALGFIRCFIQTPLPLVLSEEYSEKFSTAFSLYMAINGMISLIFGPLMSMIKAYTNSDKMVCHLLTIAFICCVVSWTIELIFQRKSKNRM